LKLRIISSLFILMILCACSEDGIDILVFDYGSPQTARVAQRLDELKVSYKVTTENMTVADIAKLKPRGIIFSGSPYSVLDADGPRPPQEIYDMGIPILGLCYGLQLMADQLGAQVERCEKSEFGVISPFKITGKCEIIPEGLKELNVWYFHEDCVESMPKDFDIVGYSSNTTGIAIACNNKKKLYGVQFHPERLDKTPDAMILIDTFVNKVVLKKESPSTLKAGQDRAYDETEKLIASLNPQTTEELDLSNKGLSALPANIGRLTNLKSLRLNNNPLTSLPPEIGKLKNLSHLAIYKSQLKVIPPEVGELSNLTYLAIYGGQITEVPASIGKLKKLDTLALDSNKLTKLPKEIGELQKLDRLYLNFNQLQTLPAKMSEMTNLRELQLANNQLVALPSKIGGMENLMLLSLHKNHLKDLPKSIVELKKLRFLDLKSNDLETLPENLGQLAQLEVIMIADNEKLEQNKPTIDLLKALKDKGVKVLD
jgi:GMP synthase (glutamine-hydrolysing) A subunit